jgi:gas vesicle structural protein
VATRTESTGYLARPQPSGLAEVVDLILDKGLVIDAYVRVSLVGIEVLTIDARIVVASVDTYLRFAEAVNRLDLAAQATGLPEIVEDATEDTMEAAAKRKVGGTAEGAREKVDTVRDRVETVRDKAEDVRDKVEEKLEEARERIG